MALRYSDRVNALVLLEPALPRLAPSWAQGLVQRMRDTAASEGVDAVGEPFVGEILGASAWESFPGPVRQMVTDNGPAILTELNEDWLTADRIASLAVINQPTL